MYKSASLLFIICFIAYILFSRQPDYFTSEQTFGYVADAGNVSSGNLKKYHIEPTHHPVVEFVAERDTLYFSENDNWFLKNLTANQKVEVIYDPGNPINARVYKWAGYWINLTELLILIIAYVLLLGVAVAITGKNSNEPLSDKELEKQVKYN